MKKGKVNKRKTGRRKKKSRLKMKIGKNQNLFCSFFFFALPLSYFTPVPHSFFAHPDTVLCIYITRYKFYVYKEFAS